MACVAAIAGVFIAVLASANAFTVTITNECSSDISLYTRLANVNTDEIDSMVPGASVYKSIAKGYEGHFRNGSNNAATLVELSTKGDLDLTWYDIGIIPPDLDPGHEFCSSLQECKDHSYSGIGFNTPVQVTPTSNTGKDTCEQIKCLADGCVDAYNFPKDDHKTHSCAFGTDFIVTFCPSGDTTSDTAPEMQNTSVHDKIDSASPTPEKASADLDSGAGKEQTQNNDVDNYSDTVNADVNQQAMPTFTEPDVYQSDTPAVEVTPAFTPASAMSNACV